MSRRIVGEKRAGIDVARLQHRVREVEVRAQHLVLIREANVRAPRPAAAIGQRRRHHSAAQLREVELVVPELEKSIDAEIQMLEDALPDAHIEIVIGLRADAIVAAVDGRRIGGVGKFLDRLQRHLVERRHLEVARIAAMQNGPACHLVFEAEPRA